MKFKEKKEILETLFDKYNRISFIESDPISIPHQFSLKEDIEISGFLSASLAWGQRNQIIKNGKYLLSLMDNAPYDFVVNSGSNDLAVLDRFYYRTFKSEDTVFFIQALKFIYLNCGGLEKLFTDSFKNSFDIKPGLVRLYHVFSKIPHKNRSMKHIANVEKGSSAKRLNMFLRWMVREDNRGVDFGIWHGIPSSALYIPLDIHSGNTARELKILWRKQNDWKSVLELTQALRNFDPEDPVKYDFALFGAGVDQKNISPLQS